MRGGEDPKEDDDRSITSYGTAPYTDVLKSADLREITPTGNGVNDLFCDNTVVTAKYTWYSFIPLALLEQFNRAANAFFLILCILMYLGTYSSLFDSPSTPWSTFYTLVAVVGVSMMKSAYEDAGRQVADKRMNNLKCKRIVRFTEEGKSLGNQAEMDSYMKDDTGATIIENLRWGQVQVGNLLYLEKDEQIPADVVLLASSEIGSCAYVETSNIDGEINVKVKESVRSNPMGSVWTEAKHLCTADFGVYCEAPNSNIHAFKGLMRLSGNDISISTYSLLLRGSTLKNTKWAVGVTVYTGKETKTVMNSRDAPFKVSAIEKVMNQIIVAIIATLTLLTIFGVTLYVIVKDSKYDSFEYLCYGASGSYFSDIFKNCDTTAEFKDWTYLFSFFILFSGLLPISMYVLVEMANFSQSYFIESDLDMYHEETDTPAQAKATNMNADLGMVEFIFSDKTGTLTQNEMVFKRCSIAGTVYGAPLLDKPDHEEAEHKAPQAAGGGDPSVPYKSLDELKAQVEGASSSGSSLEFEFALAMAICHTIVVAKDEDPVTGVETLSLEAESPDEEALCQAAKEFGLAFVGREPGVVIVEDRYGRHSSYELLATVPFDSTRKRMSALIRRPDGTIVLFTKGADEVIFARMRSEEGKGAVMDHLLEFAVEGLRTLVLAKREISASEYDIFKKRWDAASSAVMDREKLMADAATGLEQGLELIGASAIEDKLQEGVPDTLKQLREAGIKLWVLTGDKVETAINIGSSSGLLETGMAVVKFVNKGDSPSSIRKKLDVLRNAFTSTGYTWADTPDDGTIQSMMEEMMPVLGLPSASTSAESDPLSTSEIASRVALVVDGFTLSMIMGDKELEARFLAVSRQCRVVLACRVSPEQKRLLVRMIKLGERRGKTGAPVTLSIGDGANDVAMIQEAQIGVGISGREGRQAVNSSDFAVAQFRYLRRLLFVHGRTNYVRNSLLVSFSLYKSYVLTGVMFLYIFYTNFTAQNIFNSFMQSTYNVIIALPVLCLGIFNRDVSEATLEKHRFLYATGRLQQNLNFRVATELMLRGLVDIIIIFFLPTWAFNYDDTGSAGRTVGHVAWGVYVYTSWLMTMCVRSATLTCTWTCYNYYSYALSLVLEIIFLWWYGSLVDLDWDFYGTTVIIAQSSVFWMLIFFVPVVCWYGDSVITTVQVEVAPSFSDMARDIDSGAKLETGEAEEPSLNDVQTALSNADDDSSLDVTATGRGGSISSANFDHTAASEEGSVGTGQRPGVLGNLSALIFPTRT